MKHLNSLQNFSRIIEYSIVDVNTSYIEALEYLKNYKYRKQEQLAEMRKDDFLRKSIKEFIKRERHFRYQSFVRTTFSYIEAIIFALKQLTLAESFDFTSRELIYLQEKKYEGPNRQSLKEKTVRMSIADNVSFTLKIAFKVFSNKKYNVSGSEWNNFVHSVKIRNRITHPRSPKDFSISKNELECIVRAFNWLSQAVFQIMKKK